MSINLNDYYIKRYSNGSSVMSEYLQLTGYLQPHDVVVVTNGQLDSVWAATFWSLPVDPVLYNLGDLHCSGIYPTPFYFNGDDAMTLEYQGIIVDIFGKVGEDPGGAWTDDVTAGYTDANGGTWWTKRQTLIRKPTVKQGVTQNPILFNPTLEYDSLPDATYSNLGSHVCDCSGTTSMNDINSVSYVMYPNPANKGNFVAINSKNPVKLIKVTNMLGETVVFDKLINTANLSKGFYLVNISFENGILKENKLIIN